MNLQGDDEFLTGYDWAAQTKFPIEGHFLRMQRNGQKKAAKGSGGWRIRQNLQGDDDSLIAYDWGVGGKFPAALKIPS